MLRTCVLCLVALSFGCAELAEEGGGEGPGAVRDDHRGFPIAGGVHALGRELPDGPVVCESCHPPSAESFRDFTCFGCHAHPQPLTDALHGSAPAIADYAYAPDRCYACHADGARVSPFLHAGFPEDARCATCHAAGMPYAALPAAGIDHAAIVAAPADGGPDCRSCHTTAAWREATRIPRGAHDPARDLRVVAQIPTYSGAEISALTPRTETLIMPMEHEARALPEALRTECASCHPTASSGVYRPGTFHASLAARRLSQPGGCLECHASSAPVGFVGAVPARPAREPPSGEMKHDAVLWAAGAPTATRAVPGECGLCHDAASTWRAGARFHAPIARGGLEQPASCIDCHASTRPNAVLTRANATLPAGAAWSFDHSARITKAECATCHQASVAGAFASWSGGKFHLAGSVTPASCTPCHEGDRPTSTARWASATYRRSPFDYVTNPLGITHGDGQDCAMCHRGPGTGAWGGTQSWQGGSFSHDPASTPAGTTCRDCHTSQRPDLQPGTTASAAAAALDGFDHAVAGTGECKGCHEATVAAMRYVDYFDRVTGRLPGGDWRGAVNTPSDASDPARDVTVASGIPSYAGTSIVAMSPLAQTLSMRMSHSTPEVPSAVLAVCGNCHPGAGSGTYYPGNLHSSLENANVAQPVACLDCHGGSAPAGFVGPEATRPPRAPPSGEMKHDAVVWSGAAPTAASAVPADCGSCHVAPAAAAATWATGKSGSAPALYHRSLLDAGAPALSSCLDCHANSRPARVLSAGNAALPAGLTFDHGAREAMADCAACHSAGNTSAFTTWAGGQYHAPGSRSPASCLPCHEGERPTSAAGWRSATFRGSPFDYGTSASGQTHGAGQDCVGCHAGPGSGGTWGGMQSWVGGSFQHGPGTLSASTCIACHATQRPDLLPGTSAAAMAAALGFDHAASGTGDCFGCHQATVARGTYARYTSAATGMLPGGDWVGGQAYPGSAVVAAPDQLVTVTELVLQRSGSGNLVRGMTAVSATLHNAMLHTSRAVPAAIASGPDAAPDYTTCWRCHQSAGTAVSSFAGGRFHAALDGFRQAPGGAVTPLPQPTSGCVDCHAPTRPGGIVLRGGSALAPMDHAALFASPTSAGGRLVTGVADMDCSTCHDAGRAWGEVTFHDRIGAAVPLDCTSCHYPLMADRALSDTTSGSTYAMRHASDQLGSQSCEACHSGALGAAATANLTAPAWRPGALHAGIGTQPRACLDCHAASTPAAATQSTTVYALAAGATATNGGQWMSHGAATVVGRDCATCHAADARAAGAAWSRSTPYHAAVSNPSSCQECHGVANGRGATPGAGNNLPAGLTSSDMISTASLDPSTGVPAGTRAQIDHADLNVRAHDCGFCHAQVGPSSAAGVQGREWAQASFHPNFTGAAALITNGTTGRCSNCHMNVRPGAAYAGQDHSAFTAASAVDCSACHSVPGTGTLIAPNWQGAAGVPPFISTGGFTIPRPPATSALMQAGINGLAHPAVATGGACTDCHATAQGGRRAHGYDHASLPAGGSCNACHEAGSDLVGTPWNGATTEASGAGDTRPFTLTSITARYSGNSLQVRWPTHFYPVDCQECHLRPAGNGYTTTGTAYRTNTGAWGNNSTNTGKNFPHDEQAMTRPTTCLMCHNPIPD